MKRLDKNIFFASITYETALILPLFMGVLIFFLSFYQLMAVQEILSSTAYYVAEETSLYGFVNHNNIEEEGSDISLADIDSSESFQIFLFNNLQQIAGKVISSLYFNFRIGLMLNDNFISSYFIKDGIHGISFAGSEILLDDLVIIKISYYFKVPIFQNLMPPVKVVQNVIVRSFSGHYVPLKSSKDIDEDEEKKVYIAEKGEVYHIDRNCTYIKLSIREERYSNIHNLRSESENIYYECSLCKGYDIYNDKVYVTDYGSRYHKALSCSGIKRSVTLVKLSEADDKRPCSKCAGGKKN